MFCESTEGGKLVKKIDKLLEAYASEHGLTGKQLANELGICTKTLYNIRMGRRMTLDTAFLISSRLGITLDDLYMAIR